jgi:hypothetical protein
MYLHIATASYVGTHELLRCAADCTGTQRPVHETPIITAPCPAALEPNRGSSRMLLQAGPFLTLPTVAEANGIASRRMREPQSTASGNFNFTLLAIQRRTWFGRRPVTVEDGFDPRTVHVGFVEGKVALR